MTSVEHSRIPNFNYEILIIDDEPIMLQASELVLMMGGYNVRTIDNGTDAVNIVLSNPEKYKIILLDLMMKDISGYDVLKELQDIIAKNNIFVIVYSGLELDHKVEEAKALGAKAFLIKSQSNDILLDIINNFVTLLNQDSN